MKSRHWLTAAALLGGTGILLGAFGAHALKDSLEPRLFAAFETGTRYQMYSVIALLAVYLLSEKKPTSLSQLAGYCSLGGSLIFSISLYALSITGIRWLGAITPIGGLLMIAGWMTIAYASSKD